MFSVYRWRHSVGLVGNAAPRAGLVTTEKLTQILAVQRERLRTLGAKASKSLTSRRHAIARNTTTVALRPDIGAAQRMTVDQALTASMGRFDSVVGDPISGSRSTFVRCPKAGHAPSYTTATGDPARASALAPSRLAHT
jgi:hypothetical protein